MNCMRCRTRPAADDSTVCHDCRKVLDLQRRKPKRMWLLRWLGLLLALALVSPLSSLLRAADPLPQSPSVVAGRSIVPVQVSAPVCTGFSCERQVCQQGSAVVFAEGASASGRAWAMLTAKHVVAHRSPQAKIEVWLDGQWRRAKCRNCSKYADLALLTAICPGDPVLSCLALEAPAVGDPLFVAGMSLGLEYQCHPGHVTHGRGIVQELNCARSIIPGESGGGVFDARGDLVGILVSHQAQAPWEAQYVGLGELRRFVGAAWDSSYSGSLNHSSPSGPEPRLAPESEETRDERREPEAPLTPAASGSPPSSLVAPPPAPPPSAPEPENLPQSLPAAPPPAPVTPENPVIPAAAASAPPPVVARESAETRDERREARDESQPAPAGSPPSSLVPPPPPPPPRGWWDFGLSGVTLGLAIAGAVATGGIGGVAVIGPAWKTYQAGRVVLKGLRVRRETRGERREPDAPRTPAPSGSPPSSLVPRPPPESGVSATPIAAPFPRQLDEARQLLRLRAAEGRVPLLDSLRGVFLDDELDKLSESGDVPTQSLVTRLRKAIDDRVSQVAPLSVKV